MPFDPLSAVSSVDGRYRAVSEILAPYLSEYGLIRMRMRVECEYLIALAQTEGVGLRALTVEEVTFLKNLSEISMEDARVVKQIEKEGYEGIPATNHDVKAIEYFIKSKLKGTSLSDVSEWVHFALTSEDVNSVAYGLSLRAALERVWFSELGYVSAALLDLAQAHAESAMLARTHGQPATPTTFGKEMKVFERRLDRQVQQISQNPILVKWGGPSGNYNAQVVAIPHVDWMHFARTFIQSLNEGHTIPLVLNEFTTQIEPHDTYAELFDSLRRVNTILIDLSEDMWRYISDGWAKQKPKEGEVGSSAMPHKVNPIDFENAEGNLGVANVLCEHFARKLPISRLQRDLSDSTVERVFGTAFAHSLIAYKSLTKGLAKITIDSEVMLAALLAHPEILAEAIQTVLRREGVETPYEKLKALTRGKQVTMEEITAFMESLEVPEDVKKRLRSLSPATYTGLAGKLAKGSV